ncbi:MAG: ribbon-helix-helix protein, CopG family [Clostridia bacterium]|nr:ribbon-helix-helix protein, CopG family [Clostridia bacterium]
MTVSVRLKEEDTALFKKYAALNNISLSDMIRNAVLEKIEDEYDLESYEKAIAEYKANPVTYSHEDVARMLDLE